MQVATRAYLKGDLVVGSSRSTTPSAQGSVPRGPIDWSKLRYPPASTFTDCATWQVNPAAQQLLTDLATKQFVYGFDERNLKNILRLNTYNMNIFLNSFADEGVNDKLKINKKASTFINQKLRGKNYEREEAANPGVPWWQEAQAKRNPEVEIFTRRGRQGRRGRSPGTQGATYYRVLRPRGRNREHATYR